MLRCKFLPCFPVLAIGLAVVLEPGPAAGFVAPLPACHPPTQRFNAAHASRRSYVAARALSALRGQQQVEEKDQADVPGTASLFHGAPFPPPFFLPFLVPATGGALFGYDIGATSSVTRILGENPGSFGDLGAGEIGLIASGSLLGAMFASTLLIGIGDKQIGRKLELNLAAGLYALGTVLQVVAGSVPALVAGRILYGLGIGTAMHVAPLYIGETAPNDLRGKLVSLKEAAIVLGIVAGYATGAVFGSGDSPAWQPVYGCALPVAALMLAGVQTLPESARWLALRGREKEAIEAVVQLQGAQGSRADAEQQVAEMMAIASKQALAKEAAGGTPGGGGILENLGELVETKANRKALVVGIGLVVLQQLSGQPSVLYYANRIFERAGLGFEAAVGVGLFKALMTLVSVQLVDSPRWGRRPLLLLGTAGMTVSLAILGVLFAGGAENINQGAVIGAIVAYVGCYQIGFGPISWLILSEVFPQRIRSSAVSLGTLANFASNLLVTAVFEAERQSLGESLLFLQFAAIAGAAVAFEYILVPETRGLSLEQIEAQLDGDVKPSDSKGG